MTLPLFEAYPALIDRLGHCYLADLPTPVQPLSNLGFSNAWIKRDDVSNAQYGGNKIRKLEFILPEIKQQNKSHVITFGAIGTNAGVATALMCKLNALRCSIYLFDQPVTETVRKNLAFMQACGAELIYKGSLTKTALAYYLSPFRLSRESYFLFAGCSNPVATLAYVNAAFELKEQIKAGLCEEPSILHVPVGSCATLAGLTLGVKMAGLKTHVKGTRVAPSHVGPVASCTPAVIDKMIHQASTFLKANISELKHLQTPTCTLLEDQYGEGYGLSTPQADQAIQLMKEKENIPLEATYSGKAFAAFLEDLHKTNEPVLFWDTYNSQTMNAELEVSSLPGALRRHFS